MCVCVKHLQFLLGRSAGPGKQCLVLSLVFYVSSKPRAQAALCGQEVAGLTPDRPMQLFTTAGHIHVCTCLCAGVHVYMCARMCECSGLYPFLYGEDLYLYVCTLVHNGSFIHIKDILTCESHFSIISFE